ncbi:UNVERIFIED_CONTAM: hypothetical protein FKN15_029757 [Acipenser sinensis]
MAAVTFIKQDVRKNDAGNYTCMYGKENPGDVKNISHGSSVYLNVQGMLTLQLSKEIAMEGMDISFKCMIPDELRDAAGKEDFFHLYKNGILVDSQPDPKGLPDVEFSITNVKRSDTGNYSCVYGKDKFVNSANRKHSRPVYLHVTGNARPIVRRPLGAPVLDRQRNSLDSNSRLAGYRAHPALTWSAFTGCATREP